MTTPTVTLSKPITHDGQTVKTLTLREPTVADEIAAARVSSNAQEQEVHLVGILSGLGAPAIMQLSSKDYRRVQAAIAVFFSGPD